MLNVRMNDETMKYTKMALTVTSSILLGFVVFILLLNLI